MTQADLERSDRLRRRRAIARLVRGSEVTGLNDLRRRLAGEGIEVDEATLRADVRRLGITRSRESNRTGEADGTTGRGRLVIERTAEPPEAPGPEPLWLGGRVARHNVVSAVCVGAPILVFAALAWRLRWTHDDGFINFRIVDQVFAGHGPVYNSGERVEAYTSPLFLAVLIVLRALFGWAIDQAWLAVLVGIGGSIGGFVAAAFGAARLSRARRAAYAVVPFTILVPLALPPTWEYATSGLETGISLGWMGLSFWLLARVAVPDRAHAPGVRHRVLPVAFVVGLGPLVRPELAIHSAGFIAVLSTFSAARSVSRWRMLAAALALPVGYQIFRMGYFATLVPNTALAKAAGGSRWGQGWYYLMNTVRPYYLLVPAAAMVAWLALTGGRSLSRRFGGRDGRNLALAMIALGALYGLYVVKVGGDYMHGRMNLLPIFSICCPLAVVAIPHRNPLQLWRIGCLVVTLVWAASTALTLRPPPPSSIGPKGVAEQRVFYVSLADNPHPVTLDEWRRSPVWQIGDRARRSEAAHRDVLLTFIDAFTGQLPEEVASGRGKGTLLFADGIGVTGERAGVDVAVIDLHGLADPIASRLPVLQPRGLAGHEKVLPEAWAEARAGVPRAVASEGGIQATEARGCGDVGRLLHAIDGPLGPSRFLSNIWHAPSLTFLTIPRTPLESLASC